MRRAVKSFVDIEFLRAFSNACPNVSLDSGKQLKVWLDLRDFIAHRSAVTLVADKGSLEEFQENGLVRRLQERWSQSDDVWICDHVKFSSSAQFVESNSPCTFIFGNVFSPDVETTELGVVTVTTKDFLDIWTKHQRVTEFHVGEREGDFYDWNQLSRFRAPLNSLVIVDNYLFKDATKKIDIIKRTDSNILALLQQLIPKRAAGCSIPLEIMIITVETDLEPGKIRDHITNHLKKHLHIHNLEVSIVLIFPTRYHDRHFLTQFFYLTTGKGFNYFKDNLKLDAHLSTYLSISPWAASRSSDSDSKTFGEIARLMLRDLGRAISQKKAGSVGGQTSRLIDWAMKT